MSREMGYHSILLKKTKTVADVSARQFVGHVTHPEPVIRPVSKLIKQPMSAEAFPGKIKRIG
jgi:hypothetical protein